MIKRLFIVGNGFDLAHNLPTSYEKDFKRIAKNNESVSNFWELYSFDGSKIWSNFENCLAHPDFNSLEEIFNGFFLIIILITKAIELQLLFRLILAAI